MDLDAIGTVHAVECEVDGHWGLYLVDGQHRVLALIECGLGDWLVDVAIHRDKSTTEDACDLFLDLNTRASVGTIDKFLVSLRAGAPAHVAISKILGLHGLAVKDNNAAGGVKCAGALLKSYALDGGVSLSRAINILKAAMVGDSNAFEGALIEAVSRLINKNIEHVDDSSLVKKLSKSGLSAARLIGMGKTNSDTLKVSKVSGLITTIAGIYNHGRRTGVIAV